MNYDKSNIYLAKIRYLNKDKGEFNTDIDVYTFLQKNGERYVNFFRPELDYPVYIYAYSMYNNNGDSNGVYLSIVQGEILNGCSYVIQRENIRNKFETIDDIEQFMICSPELFFIDRIDVIKKRIKLMEAGELKNDLFDLEQYHYFQEMDEGNYWHFMNSINTKDSKAAKRKK